MIGRIADQVKQRLADLIQHRPVQLDLLTLDVEPDALAQVARQVPHQAGKALEHLSYGRHPRCQHLGLHRPDEAAHPIAHLGQFRVARVDRERGETILGDDQLAHLLHQRI
ncbi:MAG: hypothetical protein JF602_00080, partial [Gemmatimonadetes bacterium]|nr:hypothetical protein [Gemmatimonadota bacterium]